jgi:hypothetical protein
LLPGVLVGVTAEKSELVEVHDMGGSVDGLRSLRVLAAGLGASVVKLAIVVDGIHII